MLNRFNVSRLIRACFSKETHFGYQQVSIEEKQNKVNQVFTNVSSKYDVMNDAMSFGVHRLWKDYFVSKIMPLRDSCCLDVAGGTGDVAFRIVNSHINEKEKYIKCHDNDNNKEFSITICDINPSMIDVGKEKAEKIGLSKYIQWKIENAEKLSMPDNSFDLYTIAFGIRNCTNVQQVLNEAYRVLKPYGRFACLEFSAVDNFLWKTMYDKYSFEIIPVMGQLIAGDWRSYKYLVESIRQFPNQNEFKSMIETSGFKEVTYENLLGGIACIHSGYKI